MRSSPAQARLNVRLAASHKRTIEDAADALGQTISDFAVSTLVEQARKVIRERSATELTEQDRAIFMAMLDDETTRPNKALLDATKRYKKQVR